MKKAIASGLVGLIALGGGVAVAAPGALAQDTDDTTRQEAREARKAERTATITEALGVSADELQAAKESGQSIADIATAQGVDIQNVIDSIVANIQARIDEKVATGDIDADRAAEKSENLEERVTSRVNGERGERGERGDRGNRGPRTNAPGATADASF